MNPCASAPSLAQVVAIDAAHSDVVLVGEAIRGSRIAKERLFRRHVKRVSNRIYRLLGNDHEREDAVQDTFVTAFSSLDRLRQFEAFAGWLDAIATRTAIAVLKRRRFLRRLGFVRGTAVDFDLLASRAASQDLISELRSIYEVIADLPVAERVALTLRRVEQMELTEIAEQMGISLATVKRRLSSAEQLVAGRLRPQEEVP